MKKYSIIVIIIIGSIICFMIGNNLNKESEDIMEIVLLINNKRLSISLEDNLATKKLINILKEKDIVINAYDYGNFEKVGELGFNLPTEDKKITTNYGDIVLYNGNEISLFYNSNTWSYTKLGHINNISKEELINIIGNDDITYILKLE